MPFCKKCGNKLADNAKFCNKCGTPVVQTIIPIKEIDGQFVADLPSSGNSHTVSLVNESKDDAVFASSSAGEMNLGGWGVEETPQTNVSQPAETHRPKETYTPKETYKPKTTSKPQEKKTGKKFMGGIMGLVLPTAIITIGIGLYSYFTGNDGDGTSGRYLPNILPEAETSTTSGSIDSRANSQNSVSAGDAFSDLDDQIPDIPASSQSVLDDDGFGSLDDMSDSELKAYEEHLFGTSMTPPEVLRQAYQGTWKSVGIVVLDYTDIADYREGGLEKLIDHKIKPYEDIDLILRNGKAQLWFEGELHVSGKYYTHESGIITIDTDDDDSTVIWMSTPDNKILYSYISYIDDDGKSKASCIKYKRVK